MTKSTTASATVSDWLSREVEIDRIDTEIGRMLDRFDEAVAQVERLKAQPGPHPGATLLRIICDVDPLRGAKVIEDAAGLHLRTDIDDPQVQQIVEWFEKNFLNARARITDARDELSASRSEVGEYGPGFQGPVPEGGLV